MAKYWEDWSGSTLSAAPTGWSLPWGSNFTTFEVQADVDGPAGRRLRCLNAGTKRTAITHDAASADADRVDFKIRALCRLESATTVFVLHSGAAGRVAGSSGNETAYVGVFQQNGSGADRRVASYRYTTGSLNEIHLSTDTTVWATGTLYWIKLDVVGDQVTVAIAPHGDELNDIYTNTTTNANITAAGARCSFRPSDPLLQGTGASGGRFQVGRNPHPIQQLRKFLRALRMALHDVQRPVEMCDPLAQCVRLGLLGGRDDPVKFGFSVHFGP